MNTQTLSDIYIPIPCHENWDEMTQAEQGRFCNACSKTVVDFSLMTNDEIIAHLNSSREKVCGRFTETQLKPQRKITQKLKVFLYALFAVFLIQLSDPLYAQIPQATSQSVSGTIYGRVTDEKKQPLDFATVRVYEGDILKGGGKTDMNGNYEIKPLAPGNYTVKVNYIGMQPMEIGNVHLDKTSVSKADIAMKKMDIGMKKDPKVVIMGNMVMREKGERRNACPVPVIDPTDPGTKIMRKSDMKKSPL